MAETDESTPKASKLAPRCVSIDLEVGKTSQRIHRIGAVRGDTRQEFSSNATQLDRALAKLDDFAEGAAFVLGHNVIDFDLPHLRATSPRLRLLELPVVDTLRLNPLAFPRNPYHRLVKHYQDGQLKRCQVNDPTLDSKLTLDVFLDQREALRGASPDLLTAWHWLTTVDADSSALDMLFKTVRQRSRPSQPEATDAISRLLADRACTTHGQELLLGADHQAWPFAYALAWLSVAGEKSVMPPWVRHQFPRAGEIVRLLRDTPCTAPACGWCAEHHDARKVLQHFFGFSEFRPEPVDANGRPMQQVIVEAAMRGEHVLGILPTGTGKSVCYQIPALARYFNTGALTVVISPLVALMADQVNGLRQRGIESCAALNGLLSMPERADVLDGIRLGDVGILIVSPEQLRSRALRKVLDQREIGAWVMDEAHCLSKWGHDFRPDYRYVGRYIKERAGKEAPPPILCLTATAKPDVVRDITLYFESSLGIPLKVFDGGANRSNLDFDVVPTTPGAKYEHVHSLLESYLPTDQPSGAIVYCATRRSTEELAEFLIAKGVSAGYFHAKLKPEAKKLVQEDFIRGEIQVIAATNAFGMGIDKPDVRLVVHADIPGSLENYLQEAGRAGRDREAARCVLLYTQDDVERQFGMSAHSRLSQREIQAILRSLKRLDVKKRGEGEIIATAGEILAEDEEADFERDVATDDTRVRTAICWLEESKLLTRDENVVQIFPSSLRVGSLEQADAKLEKLSPKYRNQLRAIVSAILDADSDEGITTDELTGVSGLTSEEVRKAFYDLEHLGVASNDTALTAYVHTGVERSSVRRFDWAAALESSLIAHLRVQAPDLAPDETSYLHLRHATQALIGDGIQDANPTAIMQVIRALSRDGRGDDSGRGSLRAKRIDQDHVAICLNRKWNDLEKTAELRRDAARRMLEQLISSLPQGARGTDLLAETTMGKLSAAIEQDAILKLQIKDLPKLVDRSLLWLHEQQIIRLNKGLAVFRPAMTIRLNGERRGFSRTDFEPLKLHYSEQVLQIHVMAEYAMRGLQAMADAVHLAMDYFSLQQDAFMQRWLPGRDRELSRETTPQSWHAIVEALDNPVQQRIVADDREQTNVLVLAGPGSGKTRVLVHRIAYLIRAKREHPRGILALAYNRHAAVEIRRRLHELIGDDAIGVTILTCHAMAMRLTGASFAGRDISADDGFFDDILTKATELLTGKGLLPDEADEQRERLLAGFRWILVDEYQDIGAAQYGLISALAGRTLNEDDGRLGLFAVGDDDQNIYAFAGASVAFIRRFEEDYKARPSYLIENYRSSRHIINGANRLIEPAADRLKSQHSIQINKARRKDPAGGEWERRDPVGRGRIQILPCHNSPTEQAMVAMHELERLAALDRGWDWAKGAVIAREWRFLNPIRAYCELKGIPVQVADEQSPKVWRLRETQALLVWLRQQEGKLIRPDAVNGWLSSQPGTPWNALLHEAVATYELENGTTDAPRSKFIEWLAEWGQELRRKQTGLLLLSAHRAKGLEFDHVVVLDGSWQKSGNNEDRSAARRLYYVAMTRAKRSLSLMHMDGGNPFLAALPEEPCLQWREALDLSDPAPELGRLYQSPDLRDIDIGYAGRFASVNLVHNAIAKAQPGDTLRVVERNNGLELLDHNGIAVGRMARAYAQPAGYQCISAQVAAITTRFKEDSEPEFHRSIKCDRWEVAIPQFVFEPVRSDESVSFKSAGG